MGKKPKQNLSDTKFSVRAIAYLRTSTDEQELGIDAQRREVEQWSSNYGISIEKYCIDQGVSGTTDAMKRPGLSTLLGMVSAGGIDYLIVTKADRLARGHALAGFLEYVCARKQTKLLILNQEPNPNVVELPEKKLMNGVLSAFSEYERSLIGIRTKAALAAKKAAGERLGRPRKLDSAALCDVWWAIQVLRTRHEWGADRLAVALNKIGIKILNSREVYRWLGLRDPMFFRPHATGLVVRKLINEDEGE